MLFKIDPRDRTYLVRVQADAPFRGDPGRLRRLEVRNRDGGRVPLATLLTPETRIGPQSISRYNLYPMASITGGAAPGVSSGEALQAMEDVAARTLPRSMGFEWTGIAFQEKRVSGEAIVIFSLAVLLVYLVLAAQYESWILPLAVILVVPLGLLGVVAAVNLRGMDNNVYTQIGVVLIIALASKNAILIVEFARELRLKGRSIREAAVEASRLRFRPILMTSFAFILGMLPLVWATGAAAASRQSLGTAVFGGMVPSTVLAVFFVPVFYVAVQGLIELWSGSPQPATVAVAPAIEASGHVAIARSHDQPANGPALAPSIGEPKGAVDKPEFTPAATTDREVTGVPTPAAETPPNQPASGGKPT